MNTLRGWFVRNFSDPQVVVLAVLLASGVAVVVFLGDLLAPVLAGLVIAYLLDGPTEALKRRGLPHLAAVCTVFLGFLAASAFALLAVVPLLSEQVSQLAYALPSMVTHLQGLLLALPERFPQFVDADQITEMVTALRTEVLQSGQQLVAFSWERLGNVVSLLVYAFLVPLTIFFFLKDKQAIFEWFGSYLPADRGLAREVSREMNRRSGDYVRGKAYEIGLVTVVSLVTFWALGLRFSMLLALLTGLSVLVPYIGVAVVTVPVALVALFQFGVTGSFFVALGAYVVIQILDGNILAPLLLSEVVSLHPIAVVVAILIFGGIWGFWGLFFAIPLATLADCVLRAWPSTSTPEAEQTEPA